MLVAAATTLVAGATLHARTPGSAPAAPRQQDPDGWVERTMSEMTLRDRVAQLVVAWIEGGTPAYGSSEWKRVRSLVVQDRVGGVIIGKGPALGTASWLNQLQSWSHTPLLVAADLEWGPGTRLLGATTVPVNMALAATGDLRNIYEAGRITAVEARAAGVHMAFAPVADVNVNPANPVINTRSYGADPGTVALHVSAFIAGARDGGVLTVAKHFPGHGDTEIDSHLALPILSVPRSRLDMVELVPFRAAIGAGVDGIMTAHLSVPALDPQGFRRPATLSRPILTGLLRRELGFEGLVVTDALIMDGVKRRGEMGEVAVLALEAGADVLLMPPSATEAIDAVVAAVRTGRLRESRIDDSVRRILLAKQAVGLDEVRQSDVRALARMLSDSSHARWADRVAEQSLTLVRVAHGALPLDVSGIPPRRVAVIVFDEPRSSTAGRVFVDELRERGVIVEMARLHRSASRSDLRSAERVAANADRIVFLSFSNAAPWRGRLGLPESVAGAIDALAGRGALVFNFGNPYLLDQLPSAETYLMAWSDGPAEERAAARALVGEVPVRGLLPIPLDPGYDMGAGVLLPTIGLNGDPAPAAGSAWRRTPARRAERDESGARAWRPRPTTRSPTY